MSNEKELLYSASHEWLERLDDQRVRIGISNYAQEALGDIVYVNNAELHQQIIKGERFMDIESVKAVSDIIAPCNGTIVAINERLTDAPELINQDPYTDYLVEVGNADSYDDLMTYEEYQKFLKEIEA